MKTRVKHNLLQLIHKKEMEIGRRLKVSEIAEGAEVSERLVYRWLNPKKPVRRFDDEAIAGFCKFFECELGELLYLTTEIEGE